MLLDCVRGVSCSALVKGQVHALLHARGSAFPLAYRPLCLDLSTLLFLLVYSHANDSHPYVRKKACTGAFS